MSLNKYKKQLITLTIFLVSVMIVGFFSYTMAIENNNFPIFTRDELSEKITILEAENDELRKKGSYIVLNSVDETQYPLMTYSDIDINDVEPLNYDREIFNYENNILNIQKSGKYKATLYTELAFPTTPSRLVTYVFINNVPEFWHVNPGYQPGVAVSYEISKYIELNRGDVLSLSIYPFVLPSAILVRSSLEYLGE